MTSRNAIYTYISQDFSIHLNSANNSLNVPRSNLKKCEPPNEESGENGNSLFSPVTPEQQKPEFDKTKRKIYSIDGL